MCWKWLSRKGKKIQMIDRQLNYGRHLVERFLQDSMPYEKVLDIGAGKGVDLSIAYHTNPNIKKLYAVEAFPPNVARLEEAGITVFPLDIERNKLPLEDEAIDVVIANQILEHTKEIFWILHEITRVLPVGGKLILGVPNLASLHNRIFLLFGKQPSPIKSNSAHVRGFTKSDILSFIESGFPGGYVMRGFGGSNFYPFPPMIARPLARVFPTMAWGIFMLLEKKLPYKESFLDFPVAQRLETNFYLGHTK